MINVRIQRIISDDLLRVYAICTNPFFIFFLLSFLKNITLIIVESKDFNVRLDPDYVIQVSMGCE